MRRATEKSRPQFETMTDVMRLKNDEIIESRRVLNNELSEIESSATEKAELVSRQEELKIQIQIKREQSVTLLQRFNAERGKLLEAKRDIKNVKGELFI